MEENMMYLAWGRLVMLRSYEVSAGKHEGKRKWSEDLDWIQLAKNKNQCRYFMVMNLRTPLNVENFPDQLI
jgi:hypothetical protein